MRTNHSWRGAIAALGLSILAAGPVHAQAAPALTGTVSSAADGAMEGVLVSAKADGATITTTVVSDAKGQYRFPADRLAPGHYSLTIRAVGYELDGAGAADIAAGKTATADLTLRKAKNLWAQLSNAEWMASVPGTDKQKQFLSNCVDCHTLQRVVRSTHDAAEFLQLFKRMASYSPGSVPTHPQPTVGGAQRPFGTDEQMKPYADFLASINLSATEEWDYPLKTLPRPTGRATHVIITEYDLARPDAQPHDVIVTSDGAVWYSDFGQQFIGTLDPKTGKVTDYPLPLVKPGFPTGTLDLETDPKENLWVSMMYQTGVAEFDRASKQFHIFPLPAEWQADHTQESMVSPAHLDVDGKVWTNNQDMHAVYRLDVKTGKYENLGVMKDGTGHAINAYGMPSDLQNNLYLMEFGGTLLGHFDAATKQVVSYVPQTPDARPRRGRVDAAGRVWFAEFGADAIGMFDPKTEKIQEWHLPTKFTDPYDAVAAANGEVWTGSMLTDQVERLDPKTGAVVEYLLPRETNIRRVFFDDKSHALWVGSNHGTSIVKVEPLD